MCIFSKICLFVHFLGWTHINILSFETPYVTLIHRKTYNIILKTCSKVWLLCFTNVNFSEKKFTPVKNWCQTFLHLLKLIFNVFRCIGVTQGSSNTNIIIWVQPKKCTKEHNIPKMHISHPHGKFVLNLPGHCQTHKYEKCPNKRNRTKNVEGKNI